MIVIRLMGGLGNQLFQYGAARTLAKRLGSELRFDLSYLSTTSEGTVRDYELHHFKRAGRPLTGIERTLLANQGDALRRTLGKAFRKLAAYKSYEEPTPEFDPDIEILGANTILTGRFQSWLYLRGAEDELREELRRAKPVSPACAQLTAQVRDRQAVGIHVRRTDYVDNPVYSSLIQALPLSYYERALEFVRSKLGPDVFTAVVSDDIDWCRDQSVFSSCDLFVDLRGEADAAIEEFEVLRNCANCIISNSTFGWWAAWLANVEAHDGLVIAPAQWSHNEWVQTDTRLPPSWITI